MYAGHVEKLGKLIPKLSTYMKEMPVDDYGTFIRYKGGRAVISNHISYEHILNFSHVPKCNRKNPGFYGCLVTEK